MTDRTRRRRPLVLGAFLGVVLMAAAVVLLLNLLSSGPTNDTAGTSGTTPQPTAVPPGGSIASRSSSPRPTPAATSSATSKPSTSPAGTDEPCHIGVGTGCYNDNQRLRADAGTVNIRSQPNRNSDIVATAIGGQTVKAGCMGGGDTLEGGDGSSDMWVGVDLNPPGYTASSGPGFTGWIIASVFEDTSTIQPCD